MNGLAYKWRVLISVIFGLFMVILDTTVVNVAFPTIRTEFGANINDAQWILSVYVMALGIGTPLSGYLSDRYGSKRIYTLGLTLFVLGSLICGIAPNSGFFSGHISGLAILVAARGLQGFGGGIALPLGTALLFSAFPPKEVGIAFGVFGIALVVAPALGPILGGFLVDHGQWRAIFFINIPIGVLGVSLATLWLRYQVGSRRPAFDYLGFITSAIGFAAALYAASIAATDGWGSQRVLLWFAVGAVGLIAFAIVELFIAPEPLLDLRLFNRPVFLIATLVGYVSVLALFGAEFLLPLYLQILRGKTAFETGLILLPLAISAGIVTPFAGRLYDKIGARPLMVFGFGMLLINTWQLTQITATTTISFLLILLAIRGVALGCTVQTTLIAALSVVEVRETARASALSNATRQVIQSIGVAALATVLASAVTVSVNAAPPSASASSGSVKGICNIHSPQDLGIKTPPTRTGGAGGAGGASGAGSFNPTAIVKTIETACNQYIHGFQNAYTVTFFFALAALLLGALLPGWPLKWKGPRSPSNTADDADTAAPTAAAPGPAPIPAH